MKPRIGVSACLLGEKVRYDGADKRQPWAQGAFAGRVEWLPVCPEAELGLGVPRETIQLEAADQGVRLMTTETRRDLTAGMREWAEARANRLSAERLDGYVFKARSPSCGLGSTPVVGLEGTSDGMFAAAVRARFPSLPLADEKTLADARNRERFLRLAEAHRELRELFEGEWARGRVVDFHSRRKLLLMAHSPKGYSRLGSLVGRIAQVSREDFQGEYAAGFLTALANEVTPGRHANTLAHAAGYFSQDLPPAERADLTAAIERVGAGDVASLPDVQAQIVAYARRFGHAYLVQQVYWNECESN